mgnify:CR=1 FL=1
MNNKIKNKSQVQLLITIDNLDKSVFSFLKKNNIPYYVPYKGVREDILEDNEIIYQELIIEKLENNKNDPIFDVMNKCDIEEVVFNNFL